MDIYEQLQKEYDNSTFDDVKFTLDPEKVANGTIDIDNAIKEALGLLREIKRFLNGEVKAEYKFTSK